MTAKEMFEELGYDYEEWVRTNFGNTIRIKYYEKGLVHSERNEICFYNDETWAVSTIVDSNLQDAIIKQLEELGWL